MYLYQMRRYLRAEVEQACESMGDNTITMHIRNGDVARRTTGGHKQPACLYYETVINTGYHGGQFRQVDLVHAQSDKNKRQNPCLADLQQKYEKIILPRSNQGGMVYDACRILKAKNLAFTSSSFGITLAMMNTGIHWLFTVNTYDQTMPRSFDAEFYRRVNLFEMDVGQLCEVFGNVTGFHMVGGRQVDQATYFLAYPHSLLKHSSCL